MEQRTERYAAALSEMIRHETVSRAVETEPGKFREFRRLLKELFPALFGQCGMTEFENGFVLNWKGRDGNKAPILFMNHHDVVEAGGNWKADPFSGELREGRIWGRGTLDDKGGLWAMLQAAEELIEEGFAPGGDIWFSSSSTEETTGMGAEEIARWFETNGIRFRMAFDEGGFIVDEPVPGAKGRFALIGVGEKGGADLRFVARSNGGHSSMPEKNSPLVRLGKFMAEADESRIFTCELNPAVCEMFRRFSVRMGEAGALFAHPEENRETLCQILSASPKTAALLRTTLAFTMAHGSEGTNVIPAEAWVVGNMRYSHHQGQKGSFEAVRVLAEKYGLEMQVLDPGTPSGLACWKFMTVYAAVLFAARLVFTLTTGLKRKVNLLLLVKKLIPVFLVALTTASSAAAFGTNMDTCRNKLGIRPSLVSFGLPLGMMLHRPMCTLYYLLAVFFFADLYQSPTSPLWLVTAVLISAVMGIAAPPIPGGSAVVFAVRSTARMPSFLPRGRTESLSLAYRHSSHVPACSVG